ncbi:phage recombination protein Bet [Crenobacter cavernae]|uniref:Phage recombination protein Bet n=1 Tax=Crenobacter cavernae TaxID=2290923 RepID=A0ABY0FAI9_9NEIS|nr:phage recombination protein Bet [Crenobacter cavernae]RXZ42664.1 phage recombination protein Bet [Crenobacter cavernae]
MSTALATLTSQLASRFNLGDGAELMATLKQTAFKGQVSDAQMTALLIVANQYGLNPWTKEIYAFPDKNNGIVPVVGVDGWSRIINGDKQFDGMEFQQDEESCTCIIYRKDRNRPVSVTEYMEECKRGTGPWQSHPKRMLRHKAMIQCARLAFGFAGIYDQDEAERIVQGEQSAPRTATGYAEAARAAGQDSPERQALIAKLEAVARTGDMQALTEAFESIGKPGRLTVGGEEWGRIKKLAEDASNNIIDGELAE